MDWGFDGGGHIWMCGVKSPFCSHRFHSLMFPSSSRHENVWRSCVMIRPHCSVLLRVLYLSMCMLKSPSPLWDSVPFMLIFHVMFSSRGPQLCFSLYTTFTSPWENYREWPTAKCRWYLPAEREQPFWCAWANQHQVQQNILEEEVVKAIIKYICKQRPSMGHK